MTCFSWPPFEMNLMLGQQFVVLRHVDAKATLTGDFGGPSRRGSQRWWRGRKTSLPENDVPPGLKVDKHASSSRAVPVARGLAELLFLVLPRAAGSSRASPQPLGRRPYTGRRSPGWLPPGTASRCPGRVDPPASRGALVDEVRSPAPCSKASRRRRSGRSWREYGRQCGGKRWSVRESSVLVYFLPAIS